MSLASDLLHIIEEAHSPARILDRAVQAIAKRLHVDSCSVFLLDERGHLARAASLEVEGPLASDAAAAEAAGAAARAVAEGHSFALQGEVSSLLAAPMILRGSMVGAVVLQSVAQREHSKNELATLAATCTQLVSVVENARIIEALDRGERPRPRGPMRPAPVETSDGERILRGVAASPGVAIGTALFRGAYRLDLSSSPGRAAGDPTAERARVRSAMVKTHNDLRRIQSAAAREIDEEHALIFAAHLLLLNDPMLRDRIDEEIARGASAPVAIGTALDEFERRLRAVPDAYIQERVDDVDDLRTRLLEHVLDGTRRAPFGARIVVSVRIPPSLVIELKTEGAQALVTEVGGATSHGVLLARAMGIPAVTGIADMLAEVRLGDPLVVDGTNGVVVVRPTDSTIARYEEERRQLARARTEHARYRDVLTRTADGVRVTMHANVGVASDFAVARENGAEGIGLYRTEFPFIVRDAFPTRTEQVKIYSKAYELFPQGCIHFRILDVGADKFVSGRSIAPARSAFHGYRSIRLLFDHPDVLRDQAQALAIAAGVRPLRILIPMVSSLEELRRVKAMIEEALTTVDGPAQRRPEIGAMIEVPAAVELAADIAREVDFLSIGTNDLMQYALVVDREDSRMAALNDPYHPAILRMIARVAAAAHAAGKAVGVCGEIAALPDVALALIALGIDSLSVVPTAIPELKQALAHASLAPMRRSIGGIIALSDAASLSAALREAHAACTSARDRAPFLR
jgi:phosphotransferase system enzyme I (PtsP)